MRKYKNRLIKKLEQVRLRILQQMKGQMLEEASIWGQRQVFFRSRLAPTQVLLFVYDFFLSPNHWFTFSAIDSQEKRGYSRRLIVILQRLMKFCCRMEVERLKIWRISCPITTIPDLFTLNNSWIWWVGWWSFFAGCFWDRITCIFDKFSVWIDFRTFQ